MIKLDEEAFTRALEPLGGALSDFEGEPRSKSLFAKVAARVCSEVQPFAADELEKFRAIIEEEGRGVFGSEWHETPPITDPEYQEELVCGLYGMRRYMQETAS